MSADEGVSAGPARRLPVGAELVGDGVHFRVWAPARRSVEAVVEAPDGERALRLAAEPGGYFSGLAPGVRAGARYRYRLDGDVLRPDPASRWQPEGPHGPSAAVDPGAFRWTDAGWRGLAPEGQVIYELHPGTFTAEGTWEAASRELPRLAALGVTALELMPVAEFAGRFGWGYDGVSLYAPHHHYGTPDDLRRFVDRAHALGLGVLLDVVYNHLGPDGCYLADFSPRYFTDRYETEWGDPLNFDGEDAAPVRELFVENAACWISEYHLDGLRFDATQCIFDASEEHVLAAVSRRARAAAAPRRVLLVGENEPQQVELLRPREAGGCGLDALWNDDFHHTARVALTGRSEAYYSCHRGSPQELVSAAKHGYLYQGQRYPWQRKRRGTPTRGLPPRAFVCYLENHDQVANSALGARLHRLTSPGRHRAMTALLLLGPWTPMLFQGQEYASSRPFLYFADHGGELGEKVRHGRAEFLRQFPSVAAADLEGRLPDPADPRTFERCKLDPAEREQGAHAEALALHRDLLALRRSDPTLAAQGAHGVDGAVLGPEAFCLRLLGPSLEADRLLLVNLGRDLHLDAAPEPLLASPAAAPWRLLLSTEHPRYGGAGTPAAEDERGFHLPGGAAVLLAP